MKLDVFIKNLKEMVKTSVVKYNYLSKQYETTDSLRNFEEYYGAVTQQDSFYLYRHYDEELIRRAIYTISGREPTEEELIECTSDIVNIKPEYHNILRLYKREKCINTFEETNDYYRMLSGLPNIGESESYIRTSEYINFIDYGISNTPENEYIHNLDRNVIDTLIDNGIISKIIEDHPSKEYEYLKYLGRNSINSITARKALNFSLLRVENPGYDDLYRLFVDTYNQIREYYSSVLYVQSYSNTYEHYDSFIGFSIMIATIQRVVVNTFKFGIRRNFFDWSFIQSLYEMYNIPFIEDLSMEYHVRLMKNLNNLLRYKSTDKVFLDIRTLLGLDDIDIYRYYLIKQHKMDANNKPIFSENKSEMYDIYFKGVNITDNNVIASLQRSENIRTYSELISNDPYWIDDDRLKEALYSKDFNFIESKYIGMNLMYRMTELVFETTYLYRYIFDNNINISVPLTDISSTDPFPLFDCIVALICIFCRQHGFAGNIVKTISGISHIYGFNFNKNEISKVKQMVSESPYINAEERDTLHNIINEIVDNNNIPLEDINLVFNAIKECRQYIVDKIYESNTIEEYIFYRDLYKSLMVSELQMDVFGEYTNYNEYLHENSLELYNTIHNIDSSDTESLETLKNSIILGIRSIMSSVENLNTGKNDSTSPLINSLLSLLTFFKSYTVDIASFNIIYIFGDKFYNTLKLLDHMRFASSNYNVSDSLMYKYEDHMFISKHIPCNDIFRMRYSMRIITDEKNKLITNIT